MEDTASVLVCVTDQPSCRRLIRAGAAIAREYDDLPVRVFSVLRPELVTEQTAIVLQSLYDEAGAQGAQMTVYFNDTPALMTAVYARQTEAAHIVVGTPGTDSRQFVKQLRCLLPDVPLTIVDEQERRCALPVLSAVSSAK